MKKIICAAFACALLAGACKKDNKTNPSGGSGCASDANICFKLGDTTRSFKGEWYSILGGGRSFTYSDSLHDFSLDVGSSEARSFALAGGSLWSGGARMTYYNKSSGKSYKSYRGTVNITSVDNNIISGNFDGAVHNTANPQDTMLLQKGSLTAVPQQ